MKPNEVLRKIADLYTETKTIQRSLDCFMYSNVSEREALLRLLEKTKDSFWDIVNNHLQFFIEAKTRQFVRDEYGRLTLEIEEKVFECIHALSVASILNRSRYDSYGNACQIGSKEVINKYCEDVFNKQCRVLRIL